MFEEIFSKGNITEHEVMGYSHKLLWNEDLGIGYLKSDGYEYGAAYWENYCNLAANDFGTKLTQARVDFVRRSLSDTKTLCDVGVGAGQFVDMMHCCGTDINPFAITWLKEKGIYAKDTWAFSALSMWDVIEHIDDPSEVLAIADDVYLSTPVYKDVDACLKSKHLKPGEHIWYFTDAGIKHFMEILGYSVRDESDFESVLGRDSILSYHFRYKVLA